MLLVDVLLGGYFQVLSAPILQHRGKADTTHESTA